MTSSTQDAPQKEKNATTSPVPESVPTQFWEKKWALKVTGWHDWDNYHRVLSLHASKIACKPQQNPKEVISGGGGGGGGDGDKSSPDKSSPDESSPDKSSPDKSSPDKSSEVLTHDSNSNSNTTNTGDTTNTSSQQPNVKRRVLVPLCGATWDLLYFALQDDVEEVIGVDLVERAGVDFFVNCFPEMKHQFLAKETEAMSAARAAEEAKIAAETKLAAEANGESQMGENRENVTVSPEADARIIAAGAAAFREASSGLVSVGSVAANGGSGDVKVIQNWTEN